MAIDVVQKVVDGDDQPKGGRGVVGVGGARGLTSAQKIDSNHTLDPPISSAKIDQTITTIFDNLKDRFDDYNTYSA